MVISNYNAIMGSNDLEKKNCKFASFMAKITNLIQPLLPLILLPEFINENYKDKFYNIKLAIMMLFLFLYIKSISKFLIKNYKCIYNEDGISLKWWDNQGKINISAAKIYVITMLVLLFILIKNNFIKYSQIVFFAISLLISKIIYKGTGRFGSIWCFIAAFAPIINNILFSIKN